MILMTQKTRVTSGTLFSIWRPSERLGMVVVALMARQSAGANLAGA
jgi:hypothetical protein